MMNFEKYPLRENLTFRFSSLLLESVGEFSDEELPDDIASRFFDVLRRDGESWADMAKRTGFADWIRKQSAFRMNDDAVGMTYHQMRGQWVEDGHSTPRPDVLKQCYDDVRDDMWYIRLHEDDIQASNMDEVISNFDREINGLRGKADRIDSLEAVIRKMEAEMRALRAKLDAQTEELGKRDRAIDGPEKWKSALAGYPFRKFERQDVIDSMQVYRAYAKYGALVADILRKAPDCRGIRIDNNFKMAGNAPYRLVTQFMLTGKPAAYGSQQIKDDRTFDGITTTVVMDSDNAIHMLMAAIVYATGYEFTFRRDNKADIYYLNIVDRKGNR